jgi:predicted  nucleic acid-binding Zn-ribbon protein
MNPDLERLIALQRLDSAAREAERRIAEEPDRLRDFDARIEAARLRVASAKERLAESQHTRRAIEKDVAVHQGRLSKFREQAMAVKTNQEYHAVQHEIAFAESEIKTLEDRILERMLEADDLTSTVKAAETQLNAEQHAVEAERRRFSAELTTLRETLDASVKERAKVAADVAPQVLAVFDLVSKRRNGVALAEARQGLCTICHVRLRPQVFNTVMRNEQILQCDSCQRILYYTPIASSPGASSEAQSA